MIIIMIMKIITIVVNSNDNTHHIIPRSSGVRRRAEQLQPLH